MSNKKKKETFKESIMLEGCSDISLVEIDYLNSICHVNAFVEEKGKIYIKRSICDLCEDCISTGLIRKTQKSEELLKINIELLPLFFNKEIEIKE